MNEWNINNNNGKIDTEFVYNLHYQTISIGTNSKTVWIVSCGLGDFS